MLNMLMSVFFFVVGMEIKRELAIGELRTIAAATLPAIAALGGMLVPAGIFLALNVGETGQQGGGSTEEGAQAQSLLDPPPPRDAPLMSLDRGGCQDRQRRVAQMR